MVKELLKFVPVGSVVRLKGAEKNLIVIGILQFQMEKEKIYDYMGVVYPEGYIGAVSCALFNHEDIEEVIFQGYHDKERQAYLQLMQDTFAKVRDVVVKEKNDAADRNM